MNNRITECAALALFLVATLSAPVRAATDDWKSHGVDVYDHGHHHHNRGDHARLKQREWREDQREARKHADHPYSSVAPSQNYPTYSPYNSVGGPYAGFNSGNYLQSGAAAVRNQLTTGYANLQNAYANALASGDRNGAQHYLNALKQQQKEIAQYNTTWGSTAGTISTPAQPASNYYTNYPANNTIYSNPAFFQNTGAGLTPYNAAQIDPRLGAATALLLMGQQAIRP
jgi:hypothetical protein